MKRAAGILGAVALALALTGCAGSRRPKPAELPANPAQIGVQQGWHAALGEVDFPLQPRVLGTSVMLADGKGALLTLDAASGRELARASVGEPLTAGVGSDGRVSAVVTRSNDVVALDGAQEIWRWHLPTQSYTAPLVAGGRVFVLGADRSLTALDARTGEPLWNMQRTAEPLVLRQSGVLLAVGNTLVAGLAGRMAGINPDTGDVLWDAPIASARGTNDVERLVDLTGAAWRQGSVVCARAFQTALGCVDAASGQVLWTHAANGAGGISGDGARLFGTESDGRVMAWRADSGERLWSAEHLKWRYLSAPLALGGAVALGDSEGNVFLLSPDDGRLLERARVDKSGVAAAPVAVGGTLIVVTRKGGVYGLRPGQP